jgi:3-phenylpropionate/trans-cinnamate dioxygenase ferredoxin reductase subunit
MSRYVIVGAGEAGLRAARALREAGQDDVVLLGGEPHPPYERPPLSKPDADGAFHRPIAIDLSGVDVRLGAVVEALDRAAGRVHLADGSVIGYDRLLLATGARPRRLAADPDGVALTLRTLADATAIHGRARPGGRAVIVGAGLIGLELAATLRLAGMDVTVLEAGPRALARGVPAEIADTIVARHRAEGVRIAVDQRIEAVTADGVRLADGLVLPADLVVAAVGVVPDVRLAEAAGLACDNGIRVDARLATDDPAIFAAGDCAAVDHPRYGRVRFESWRSACDQGAFAGRAMAGAPDRFAALPWFWSDHYDLGLQAVGLHDPARAAVRRELADGAVLRFELDGDGRLAAAAGIGPGTAIARDVRLAEMLIDKAARLPADALADPGIALKALLRGA